MLKDFPGKKPDENVIMVIRKHWIVYFVRVFLFVVIAVLPIWAFIFFWGRSFPLSEGGLTSVLGYLFTSFYFLFGLAFLLISWINEEFDLFIVTDHRLIDVTQVSFLKRNVAATPLPQIQDSNGKVAGLFGTILNYGDVTVRTAAGDASDFKIDRVPDPELLARKILNFAHQSKKAHGVISDENAHENANHDHDMMDDLDL